MPDKPPSVFTRREAARELRICLRSLDKLIRSGELRVKPVGRRTLITRQAIQEFLGDKAPRHSPAALARPLHIPHGVQ